MSTLIEPLFPALDGLDRAMTDQGLRAVFQPIIRLDTMSIVAYEGLSRPTGPSGGPGIMELLNLARSRQCLTAFELHAARRVCLDFARQGRSARLLINLSAQTVLAAGPRSQRLLDVFSCAGIGLDRITLEITERDITEDSAGLAHALAYLRSKGVQVALDDFGHGHSNFEMWNELHPEVVKIDRYLVSGIAQSAEKLAIVRALCSVAEVLGAELVGEGVETPEDLRLLRELGISHAQGYLLGRPASELVFDISAEARAATQSHVVLDTPRSHTPLAYRPLYASHVAIMAPAIDCQQPNDDVADMFARHPSLQALAVTEDRRPLGLINRHAFSEQMVRPYARELFGRKPCTTFMHADPLMFDENQSLDSLTDLLFEDDQRYLTDGFIITRDGRYLGLGTGQSLVRRVTELRIEAARYANPLTFLPGNIPISTHIARLMREQVAFVTAYVDLNDFKPFNDQYGYFRGDEMIRLLASTLTERIDARQDFIGHIGGDDFMVVFQSQDWQQRCLDIVQRFNSRACLLFDEEDRRRGGIEGEDRRGARQFFGMTSVSIGAVKVPVGAARPPEFIATLAARAKRKAKQERAGFHVLADASGELLGAGID